MNRRLLLFLLFSFPFIALNAQKNGWYDTVYHENVFKFEKPNDYYEHNLYQEGVKVKGEKVIIIYNRSGRVVFFEYWFIDYVTGNKSKYRFNGGYDTLMFGSYYVTLGKGVPRDEYFFYDDYNSKPEFYGSVKSYHNYVNDTEQRFNPGEKYITLPHDPDSLFFNIPKVFGYSDSILRLKKIKRK